MLWCYTLVTRLVLPFALLRLRWRARRQAAYRARWRERLGWYGAPRRGPGGPTVVFHAVSVGEVHAARPLIDALRAARGDLSIVLTCSTPTGSVRITELFGDTVEHVYFPWDVPGAVERFLHRYEPALVVLLETELWPNFISACRAADTPVVLANARLSERSWRGYARFASLVRQTLAQVALVAAQAPADAERFVRLGLDPARLRINGSLKFDHGLDAAQLERARQARQAMAGRPVWIAASTREGEDSHVLAAHAQVLRQRPETLLVIVPRHPERFGTAAELSRQAGLRVQRASDGGAVHPDTQVLVGDTMGELGYYYGLADVAFVGGSLVDTGCQNVIEPAATALPVLTGPSRYNFQAVTDELIEAGALRVVADATALGEAVVTLLADAALRQHMGQRGHAVVARNQGATTRLLDMLLARLPPHDGLSATRVRTR